MNGTVFIIFCVFYILRMRVFLITHMSLLLLPPTTTLFVLNKTSGWYTVYETSTTEFKILTELSTNRGKVTTTMTLTLSNTEEI